MSHSGSPNKDVGPTDNERALASLVSGAIIFVGNLVYSFFVAIFRILAAIA